VNTGTKLQRFIVTCDSYSCESSRASEQDPLCVRILYTLNICLNFYVPVLWRVWTLDLLVLAQFFTTIINSESVSLSFFTISHVYPSLIFVGKAWSIFITLESRKGVCLGRLQPTYITTTACTVKPLYMVCLIFSSNCYAFKTATSYYSVGEFYEWRKLTISLGL